MSDNSTEVFLNFIEFHRTQRPNNVLIAPTDYCQNAKIDREAPIFSSAAATIKLAYLKVLDSEPRIEIAAQKELALEIVQRSRLLRFPDLISTRFIPLDDDQSTLAIYSRSVYGYGDMGVNSKRVSRFLSKLQDAI